jgi:hypothetical protein
MPPQQQNNRVQVGPLASPQSLGTLGQIADPFYAQHANASQTLGELSQALGIVGKGFQTFAEEDMKKFADEETTRGILDAQITKPFQQVEGQGRAPLGVTPWYLKARDVTRSRIDSEEMGIALAQKIEESGLAYNPNAKLEDFDKLVAEVSKPYQEKAGREGPNYAMGLAEYSRPEINKIRSRWLESTRQARVKEAETDAVRSVISQLRARGDLVSPKERADAIRKNIDGEFLNKQFNGEQLNTIVAQAYLTQATSILADPNISEDEKFLAYHDLLSVYSEQQAGTGLLKDTRNGAQVLEKLTSLKVQSEHNSDVNEKKRLEGTQKEFLSRLAAKSRETGQAPDLAMTTQIAEEVGYAASLPELAQTTNQWRGALRAERLNSEDAQNYRTDFETDLHTGNFSSSDEMVRRVRAGIIWGYIDPDTQAGKYFAQISDRANSLGSELGRNVFGQAATRVYRLSQTAMLDITSQVSKELGIPLTKDQKDSLDVLGKNFADDLHEQFKSQVELESQKIRGDMQYRTLSPAEMQVATTKALASVTPLIKEKKAELLNQAKNSLGLGPDPAKPEAPMKPEEVGGVKVFNNYDGSFPLPIKGITPSWFGFSATSPVSFGAQAPDDLMTKRSGVIKERLRVLEIGDAVLRRDNPNAPERFYQSTSDAIEKRQLSSELAWMEKAQKAGGMSDYVRQLEAEDKAAWNANTKRGKGNPLPRNDTDLKFIYKTYPTLRPVVLSENELDRVWGGKDGWIGKETIFFSDTKQLRAGGDAFLAALTAKPDQQNNPNTKEAVWFSQALRTSGLTFDEFYKAQIRYLETQGTKKNEPTK